ncbi:hypothetical protein BDW59DRAFT_136867 [Aspergillus cavernicola]|uniref:Uncharacterized protein n=1 Tax=Aspergillus cavernicola TaxID=176166 RepID=A0ABR4J4N9_9EURO
MCPMLLRDGPTILSPPHEHPFLQFPHQSKLTASPAASSRPSFTNGFHAFSSGANNSGTSFTNPTISSKPSRKRSRDDVAAEDSSSERLLAAPVRPPVPQEQPIYGEGMTLLNPRTGMALSGESQTGTWYEEAVENAMAAVPPVTSRTHASSQARRKVQRLDPSAPSLDDIASSRIQRQFNETGSDENSRILGTSSRSNPFSSDEPLVDDATRLLGISWQRVHADNDVDMAAAVRGWKKYIDRQFSRYLVDSEILMKNRALNAYLVSARPMIPLAGPAQMPAFYLFNDDLTQGQTVASSWESCLRNLHSSPIVFEGAEILASDKRASQNVFGSTSTHTGLPLLQTVAAGVGLNEGMGLGTGMDIDS